MHPAADAQPAAAAIAAAFRTTMKKEAENAQFNSAEKTELFHIDGSALSTHNTMHHPAAFQR